MVGVFEAILDSKLGAAASPLPPLPGAFGLGPDPAIAFLLNCGHLPYVRPFTPYDRPVFQTAGAAEPAPGEWVAQDTNRPGIPVPHTVRARKALDVLRRAGGGEDLGRTATDATVRRAYRRLALRFHPDRTLGLAAGERARLATLFAELASAYRVVMDECRGFARPA